MPVYVLRYYPGDRQQVWTAVCGLALRGQPPWQTRERDGWLELYSDDVKLMRQVWKMTRQYVRGHPDRALTCSDVRCAGP